MTKDLTPARVADFNRRYDAAHPRLQRTATPHGVPTRRSSAAVRWFYFAAGLVFLAVFAVLLVMEVVR